MRKVHRAVAGLLLILLASVCVLRCGMSHVNASQSEAILSYKDIPGVTQEEINAVERVKLKYKEFIYGMTLSTECFYREDGRIVGFSKIMCDRLSELFDMPFVPRIFETAALIQGLDTREIQFSGEIKYGQPSNNHLYYTTIPIAERTIKICSQLSKDALNDLSKERVMRYAFLQHASVKSVVEPFLSNRYTSVIVSDIGAAFELIKQGEVDALFHDSSMMINLLPESDLIVDDFYPIVYNSMAMATCDPALRPVISVIIKYLQYEGSAQMRTLYAEGEQSYLRYKLIGQLTESERNYLSVHQNPAAVIPVMAEYDNYPTNFYNDRENERQGVSIDILKEIADLTGMTFGYVNGRDEEFSDLIAKLESGKIAMSAELIRVPSRVGRFIWADEPYQTDYFALISRNDYPDIELTQVKHARVGLVIGAAYADVFNEIFPEHERVTEYMMLTAGFDALEAGEIDLLMATRNALLGATNYMERVGYKANVVLNRSYGSSFGFSKKETDLAAIVSKAQRLINTQAISDSWIRKVFDYRGKMARAQVPYLIGFLMLMAAVLVLLLNQFMKNRKTGRQLEHLVAIRTADLAVQTEKAQVAAKAKGEFLSRMSHEIRTPLNAIIGMTEVAKRAQTLEKSTASLSAITAASGHLLGILNDILDMSKIESGKFMLASEPFSLPDAMEEVADIIRQRCLEKDIFFRTEFIFATEPGMLGDKLRLKQVLINLLGNAVKFTPLGGRIDLCVASTLVGSDARIDFCVIDTGIGITPEQKKHLFTAFEQAHSGISARYGGTGLGLSISQSFVQEMGGEISVTSMPDRGSEFSFQITLKTAALTQGRDEDEPVRLEFPGKRILLVEDIEINRMILMELLSETKIQMDEAVDGLAAIKAFEASAPGTYDLIFMDIQMPNLNGYEAALAIRALPHPDAQTVPIVAMTANAYKEDVENAMESGMNAHLAKPVDIKIVLQTLSEFLG